MGVGAFGAGIFHLYTHAFFKALLFLGSGAAIHALHGEQDIRNMGGLKAGLPVTYWTFLIGALAIAGVPLLSGFFSKDEILFETFAEGHHLLWVIGALTSLLTATYMFRLVFLTFHGEQRFSVSAPSHSAPSHSAPSHPPTVAPSHHSLHDAPPAMATALIVLAIGSVVAGYVGVPHALGGDNQLAAWLSPAFAVEGAAGTAGEAAPVETAAAEREGQAAAEAEEAGLELTLMIVSSAIAFAGIGLAALVWLKRRDLADKLAQQFAAVYRLLLNKYYVDELYDAAVVRPIHAASRDGLWRGFDVKVIDGAVNGTGALVDAGAWTLRRIQTGSVRAYAGSILFGVVLILGYYIWR
jgi:NADH-quinone oxidoreductase subunit L